MNPYTILAQNVLREPSRAVLPQTNQFRSNPSMFSGSPTELSGVARLRKIVYLGLLGTAFGVIRYYIYKNSDLIEESDIKEILPKVKKVLIPSTSLFSAPILLSLLSNSEWILLSYICYAAALGYIGKELAMPLFGIVKNRISGIKNNFGGVSKEKGILERKIQRKKAFLRHLE